MNHLPTGFAGVPSLGISPATNVDGLQQTETRGLVEWGDPNSWMVDVMEIIMKMDDESGGCRILGNQHMM